MLGIRLCDNDVRTTGNNPDTQESNQPGICLAGVVCGGLDTHVWFIENSRVHADNIVKHITSIQ